MAGPLDPFNPGVDASPTAGVEPGTFAKVRSEWDSFLENPQGRAALLSMGLQLAQPPSFGDNGLSQVARAIGAGGESVTANQAMDLKEREATSKDESRQAQSEARLMGAESRATAAEARMGAAGARNEAQAARLEQGRQGHQLRLFMGYHGAMAKIRAENAKGAADFTQRGTFVPQPIPSLQEWVQQGGALTSGLGGGTGNPEDDTVVPAAADTTSKPAAGAPKVGDRKQFKQGWGVWDGSAWKPEK